MRTIDDFEIFVRRFFGDCNLKIQRAEGNWFVSLWRDGRFLAVAINPSLLQCFECLMIRPRQPRTN